MLIYNDTRLDANDKFNTKRWKDIRININENEENLIAGHSAHFNIAKFNSMLSEKNSFWFRVYALTAYWNYTKLILAMLIIIKII